MPLLIDKPINRYVEVDDSRAKITCSVVGYDKDGNVSYMRSVLEMPNAMERVTHSRGRAPNAAQHKRQILTGSVEIEARFLGCGFDDCGHGAQGFWHAPIGPITVDLVSLSFGFFEFAG